MLQSMKTDSNELKWIQRAHLESLFDLQLSVPKENMLWDFLWTWEITEDGRILRQVHGQEILIDYVLIHEQPENSKEGTIDAFIENK